MPASSAFLAAAALSVGLQLRAEYRGPRWQVYLFKPSTTALLLLLAVLSAPAHGALYQQAVVVGRGGAARCRQRRQRLVNLAVQVNL